MRERGRNKPLSDLFGEFPERLRGDCWHPAIDIFETEAAVIVRAEISGVRGDDVRVNVDGEILRISGVRRVPSGVEVRRLHQMEIAFGPFERELRISIPFDREGVSARLEDGFLSVVLPKHRPVRRKVEVETG